MKRLIALLLAVSTLLGLLSGCGREIDNSGYIPTAAAYDYRSYEADTGTYAKGTAEKLADQYVAMLESIR